MAEDVGVKVTLVPEITSDKFKSAVDAAAKGSKATISDVTISSSALAGLTDSINKAVEKNKVEIKSIKLKKIDASAAMKSLKGDLESLFGSLKVDGLKLSFKDGGIAAQFNGIEEASEQAAKQTASIGAELDIAKKKAAILGSTYKSMLSKLDRAGTSFSPSVEKSLTDKYKNASQAIDEYIKKLREGQGAENELAAAQSASANFNSFVQQYEKRANVVKEFNKQITSLEKYAGRLGDKTDDGRVAAMNNEIATLKARVSEFSASADADIDRFTESMNESIASARALGDQVKASMGEVSTDMKPVLALMKQIQTFKSSNPRVANTPHGERLDEIYNKASAMRDAGSYNKSELSGLSNAFSTIGMSIKEANLSGKSFIDTFKGLGQSIAQSMLLRQAFMYIRQAARDAFTAVQEVDSAMTQLRIVTGATDAEMATFFNSAAASAKELGASVSGVLGSIETFSRLGYQLKDALDLSEAATVLSNVAATSIDDATTGLTSIIKGFGLDAKDAMNVADELTLVGEKYAISASELLDAFRRGGAALAATDTSLEQAMAIFAAGNAAQQDASSVGNALKTVALRVRGATADLSAMGEEVDELAAATPKMRETILALSGVDIMDSSGNFRQLYDVLLDIAGVYDSLQNTSQAALLEALGGKRNAAVLASVIANLDDLKGAYEAAQNAAGTAAEANEIYLDSIEGKIGQFKAQFEVFSNALINSDLVKDVVGAGTAILNVLTQITDATGGVATAIGAISAGVTVKNLGKYFALDGCESIAA